MMTLSRGVDATQAAQHPMDTITIPAASSRLTLPISNLSSPGAESSPLQPHGRKGGIVEPALRAEEPLTPTAYLPLVAYDLGPTAAVTLTKGLERPISMAFPGERVTYTLSVTNTGELPVQDGVLKDCCIPILTTETFPLRVLDAEGATYNKETGVLRWDLARMDPGQSVTKHIRVEVAEDANSGSIVNTAVFTATVVDATDRTVQAEASECLTIGDLW